MARTRMKARMCTGGKAKRVSLPQPSASGPPPADVQMNAVDAVKPPSVVNVRTHYGMKRL
jgi:hypothetical protein